ncbi:hypothetical protein JCM3770_005912 [Rhodotorula araucariae]
MDTVSASLGVCAVSRSVSVQPTLLCSRSPSNPHCKACIQGHKLDGEPRGTMKELGGLHYYFAEGDRTQKDKAIVLGHDLFGLGLPNPKLVADWLAEHTGMATYVPDLMEGDYIDTSHIPPQRQKLFDEPLKGKSLFQRARFFAAQFWTFFSIIGPRYLLRHSVAHALDLTQKFCKDLREQKGHSRLGFVGYCYGGAVAVHLAGTPGSLKPVDAVVAFHPAPVAAGDFAKIAVPFMLSCAGEDIFFDSIKPAALDALGALPPAVPTEVHDDAHGTVHGYGVRPDLQAPEVREAFERGRERTAHFFARYL